MVRAERLVCPLRSHLHLLRDGKSIVDLNTEVAHGAFDLGVSQQQLDRTQVAGAAVDQGCFSAPQGVSAEQLGIETDVPDPIGDQPCVLPGCDALSSTTAADE